MQKQLLTALALATAFANPASAVPSTSQKTLTAFASEAELSELFRGWAEEYKKKMAEQRSRRDRAPAQDMVAKSEVAAAARPRRRACQGIGIRHQRAARWRG